MGIVVVIPVVGGVGEEEKGRRGGGEEYKGEWRAINNLYITIFSKRLRCICFVSLSDLITYRTANFCIDI